MEIEKMSKSEYLKRLNYFINKSPLSKYEISLRLETTIIIFQGFCLAKTTSAW